MKHIKITNLTQMAIVINSCKFILKPQGQPGDSIITEKDSAKDNDIVSLVSKGFVKISSVTKQKKEIPSVVVAKTNNKNDKESSIVTYVDNGKVKKAKMTKHQENIVLVDDDSEGDEETHPAMIDSNPSI